MGDIILTAHDYFDKIFIFLIVTEFLLFFTIKTPAAPEKNKRIPAASGRGIQLLGFSFKRLA